MSQDTPAPSPPRARRSRNWKLAAASAVLGALVSVGWLLGRPSVPPIPPRPAAAVAVPDDGALARVLAAVVSEGGWVDYDALIAAPADLDAWYQSVAWLTPEAVQGWDEPARIAFWCNVYNGLTLLVIRENHPIPRSLSGTLTGAPAGSIRQLAGVWSALEFQAVGEAITLDHVEHGILRERFDEPRIHLAINCASVGCPQLRGEPYAGDRLLDQLEDQGRRMVGSPERFQLDRDGRRVGLSKIFSWFAGDFPPPDSGFGDHPDAVRGPLALLARYVSPQDAAWLEAGDYAVVFLPYDWHLNAVPD